MVCKDGWRSDLVEMEVTKWFGCKTVSQKIVVAEGCVCEERTYEYMRDWSMKLCIVFS